MLALRSSPWFIIIAVVITVLLLVSFRGSGDSLSSWTSPKDANTSPNNAKAHVSSDVARAGNSTLGFEKVIVIGLRERIDRRDAMVLQSSLTGFELEWIDGVKGEDVPGKALPPGIDKELMSPGNLGSWRGHMNAMRSVLENGYSSALVMEDDLDWDIRITSQMEKLAEGVRFLSNVSPSKVQHSPYGDDWDIIWAGHCGEVPPDGDDRRYVINNDETVAPKAHQPWLKELSSYPEQTRIIHKAGAPICTFAYAVSARGAQKLLLALGLGAKLPFDNLAFDNQLGFFCRDGALNIKCYSVEPMLFFHHRPAGSVSKDSDIQTGGTEVREKGFTENIVLSARMNLEQLILGTKNYVMQW